MCFGHVLLEKADVQVPLSIGRLGKSEERWQSLLLEGCIPDRHTELKVHLALRLALASTTNIQGRYKESHKKNVTANDTNISILIVVFTITIF